MPNLVDLVGDDSAEKVKCLQCKKGVTTSVECLKCGGFFHPACMVQANEAKNKTCRHVDLKVLIKDYEAQNKVIQKLLGKINELEDKCMKNTETVDSTNAKNNELLEKIRGLEDKIEQLSASRESTDQVSSDGNAEMEDSLGSLGKILHNEMSGQSTLITNKLENVAQAIITSNKDLVRFLTQNPTQAQSQCMIQNDLIPSAQTQKTKDSTSSDTTSVLKVVQSSSLGAYSRAAIRGTGQGTSQLSAAVEQKWFYLGNLSSECSVQHIKEHLNENKIPILSCEKINRDDHKSSFKISTIPDHEHAILDSNIWPVNVIVKPFIFRGRGDYTNNARHQNFRSGYRGQGRFRQYRRI